MRDLYPQLDVRGNHSIGNIAGWVRHYKNIQNHHVLGAEMVSAYAVSVRKNPKILASGKRNGYLSISQRNSMKKKKFLNEISWHFVAIFLCVSLRNDHCDLNIL